jgi:hypothetical protein
VHVLHNINIKIRFGTSGQRTVMIPHQYYEEYSSGAEHETLMDGTKNRRREKQRSLLRPQRHAHVRPADQSELPDNPLPF